MALTFSGIEIFPPTKTVYEEEEKAKTFSKISAPQLTLSFNSDESPDEFSDPPFDGSLEEFSDPPFDGSLEEFSTLELSLFFPFSADLHDATAQKAKKNNSIHAILFVFFII
jgi:hypothetical protein